MMPGKPLSILLAALCVHALPGCGARDGLEVGPPEPPRCAKQALVRPTHAPKDFVLKEFPGARGTGSAVAARPDGDILLAGSLTAGTSDLGGGPRTVTATTAFIASFDASGNHQWDRLYPEATIIAQLAVDPEGNILAATNVESGDEAKDSALFLKLDPAGDPLWTKAWPGVVFGGYRAFDVDGCGDVFLTGISDEKSRAALGVPGDGVFVVEYDPSGQVLWGKSFGGIPSTALKGSQTMALDDQGGILLAGESLRPYPPMGTDTPVDFGDGDAPDWYLVKLTSTGDLSWQQSWASLLPSPPFGFAWTFGGVDAAGEPVLVVDVVPDSLSTQVTPTGPAVVTAQRFDPSGQVISTTPLALDGDIKSGFLTLSAAAVAPSGSMLVARTLNDPTGTWMVEVDAGGAPIWSWSHPSDKPGTVDGVGFDTGGRPLAAGHLDAPGTTNEGGLFLAFDASPP
jgi:hypothetical protein